MQNFNLINKEQKIQGNYKPYVTFPITNQCTLKCIYCGDGGEMSLCDKEEFKTEDLFEWYESAVELGVEKFRITGGEPFLHKDFTKIINHVAQRARTVLVNTNGTLIKKFKDKWIDSPSNVIYVVNYHGATEETFDSVTGTKGFFDIVHEGIELLAANGRLHRLNTVYSQKNYHEIFDIINYCRKLGVGLKIQDVVSVPWQFNSWEKVYLSTVDLVKEFEDRATFIREHKYARGFGTPCYIYTIDGVNVTLKSIRNGSHYDMEVVCKDCEYYKCHEGVYDLFVFPNNTAGACNWTGKSLAPKGTKKDKLEWLINSFQRSEYHTANAKIKEMDFKSPAK